jgi:transglutaminase-like putative cysteine protease
MNLKEEPVMAKRITAITILVLLYFTAPAAAVQIVLHNGTEIETAGVTVTPPDVKTAEGLVLPFDTVKRIIYQKAEKVEVRKGTFSGDSTKDVAELLELSKMMREKYPEINDSLVLRDRMNTWFYPDGTIKRRGEWTVLVLNEAQRDKSIQVTEYTDKQTYESKVVLARAIDPDGTIHTFDPSTFVETKSKGEGLVNFDAEQKDVRRNGTIPGGKVGSIIQLVWESRNFNREEPNTFSSAWWFQGMSPVADSYLTIYVPKDKELTWVTRAVKREDTNPTEKVEGEWRAYSWRMKDLSPFVTEPDAPHEDELRPSIFISIFKTLDYYSKKRAEWYDERMKVTGQIQKKVDELTKGMDNDEDRIAALYSWVQEKIQYISIKGSLTSGQAGHPADHTFAKRQGDCIDKAILFGTLLKAAGVEAYPVIVRTNNEPRAMTDKIPMIQCNHAISEIHLKKPDGTKKIFYLDSTGSNYRYPFHSTGNHGIPAWNPQLNTVQDVPVPPAEDEMRHVNSEIELFDNGSTHVNQKIRYNGVWEMSLRWLFRSWPAQRIHAWLERSVSGENPGSKLLGFKGVNAEKLSKQFGIDLEFKSPRYAQKAENLLIFKLPVGYRGTLRGITLEERSLPVKFTSSEGKHDILRIKLPEGFSPKFIREKPFEVNNKHFTYRASFRIEGDVLVFEDRFERTSVRIPPEDYKQYRADCQKVLKFIETPLFFEKAEP